MTPMPPMCRDEAGTQGPGAIAGSERVQPSGSTARRNINGPMPVSPFGADLLDIFRRARPEA